MTLSPQFSCSCVSSSWWRIPPCWSRCSRPSWSLPSLWWVRRLELFAGTDAAARRRARRARGSGDEKWRCSTVVAAREWATGSILNLIPLPMLDGGQLLYDGWELLSGKRVSDGVQNVLQRVGMGSLLFLTILALFNDISRLFLRWKYIINLLRHHWRPLRSVCFRPL